MATRRLLGAEDRPLLAARLELEAREGEREAGEAETLLRACGRLDLELVEGGRFEGGRVPTAREPDLDAPPGGETPGDRE